MKEWFPIQEMQKILKNLFTLEITEEERNSAFPTSQGILIVTYVGIYCVQLNQHQTKEIYPSGKKQLFEDCIILTGQSVFSRRRRHSSGKRQHLKGHSFCMKHSIPLFFCELCDVQSNQARIRRKGGIRKRNWDEESKSQLPCSFIF